MFLPGYAAHLEDVYEVRIEENFQREIDVDEIEVLEGKAVEENLRSE